jgi:tRNA 2-thiocytidine biosynthesis protein TtcA
LNTFYGIIDNTSEANKEGSGTLDRDYSKRLLNTVKRTIIKYDMIKEGDVVALGVSGGKDSSTLLYIMSLVQQHAPFPFTTQAVFVDMGWEMDITPLRDLCLRLQMPFFVEKTHISRIVFEVRKEKNPCSLCAKLRRGALHKAAKSLGCNRVALGHHLDDALETFFLNLLYSGTIGTFKPHTYLDRRDVYLIRPLISLREKAIASLVKEENLPSIENPCPAAGKTKRGEMGEIVDFIALRYPFLYERFLTSLEKSGIWPLKPYFVGDD